MPALFSARVTNASTYIKYIAAKTCLIKSENTIRASQTAVRATWCVALLPTLSKTKRLDIKSKKQTSRWFTR